LKAKQEEAARRQQKQQMDMDRITAVLEKTLGLEMKTQDGLQLITPPWKEEEQQMASYALAAKAAEEIRKKKEREKIVKQ
jgi:hypothetical protein